MSIKNIKDEEVDNFLGAVGAVIKAVISVAKCFENKSELPK
jgi:hypothetical protein